MNNFLAAYLSIGLGVIFLLAGFYFKKLVLFIIATLSWFIVSFFCLADYAVTNELYVLGLGVFAFACAVISAITPYYYLAEQNAKGIPKNEFDVMKDEYDEYHGQVDAYRNLPRTLRKRK
jgi:Na+/H+ antiporter NhaB